MGKVIIMITVSTKTAKWSCNPAISNRPEEKIIPAGG